PGAAILSAHDTVRFHSAYVSGPCLPRHQRLIQELGSEVESTTTSLQLVVDRLQGPNKNPIWLPPLPTMLPAHGVLADAGAGTPEGRAGNTGAGTAAGTAAASSAVKVEPLTAATGLEALPFGGGQRTYRMDVHRRDGGSGGHGSGVVVGKGGTANGGDRAGGPAVRRGAADLPDGPKPAALGDRWPTTDGQDDGGARAGARTRAEQPGRADLHLRPR